MTTIFSDEPLIYESLISSILKGEYPKNTPVANDTLEHAKILTKHMVNEANKTIKLHSSLFCKGFYLDQEVMKAFENAAKRDVKLDIIIDYENSDEKIGQLETIKKYKELFNKNMDITKIKDASDSCKPHNFLVVDEIAYRYELDPPSENTCDREVIVDTKATGCFEDPEFAKHLIDIFEKIKNNNSTPFLLSGS